MDMRISSSAVLILSGRSSKRLQGLMVESDNNKRRRLVEFKDGCRYGEIRKN